MDFASLTGIAKPMPMLPLWLPHALCPSEAIELLMPMSSPLLLTSAPPELPGLIAAEVWMALVTTSLPDDCCWPKGDSLDVPVLTGRLRAEMMPVVTVPERPSGLPTAMAGSPTLRPSESPRVIGVRSLGPLVSLMTARSVDASVPTIVAPYVRPSLRVTVIAPLPVASPTTWLFVRMCPLLPKTTPEPAPEPCWVVTSMLTTLGETAADTAVQSGAEALPCTTVGELFWFEFVVAVAAGVDPVAVLWPPSCVTAYVPPLARTAASSATPTV